MALISTILEVLEESQRAGSSSKKQKKEDKQTTHTRTHQKSVTSLVGRKRAAPRVISPAIISARNIISNIQRPRGALQRCLAFSSVWAPGLSSSAQSWQ